MLLDQGAHTVWKLSQEDRSENMRVQLLLPLSHQVFSVGKETKEMIVRLTKWDLLTDESLLAFILGIDLIIDVEA